MTDPLFSVRGQVVLVSGASRGIGHAIAAGFAERGARVVVTGRDPATLEKAARSISADHPVRAVACDVADPSSIAACVKTVVDELGHVDTLVNVAGVNQRMPVESYTVEQYDHIVDINMRGAYLMSIEVGKHMLARGAGAQVNIDSLNTYAPLEHVTPYAMSKAGLLMMVRGLASEWGSRGVRVNSIAPGFVLTDLTRAVWEREDMQAWMRRNTPLGRLGTPADMVGAAVFLASPASSFMSGQTIRVDGGITAGIAWPLGG